MASLNTDLDSLEKILSLYEDLGGDQDPQLQDFVQVSRKWIRSELVSIRLPPFSSSSVKSPQVLHVFRDLLIFALPKSGNKNDLARVVRYLNLGQCTVKEVNKDDEGEFGFVVTVVTRLRMNKEGNEVLDGGRIVTRIEKFEVWVKQKEIRDDVVDEIHHCQEELEHEEEMGVQRTDSSVSDGGDGLKKQRSWAAKRGTLKSSRKSGLSVGDTNSESGEVSNGLSLADLEARYSIKIKPHASAAPAAATSSSPTSTAATTPTSTGDSDPDRVEFEVEFGEGPMGFSLGSGKGVGVIIGKLAPGSFAEMAGVCIGDRILYLEHKIEGVEIGVDTTWQECVEKIKALPRPLLIRLERAAARQVDLDKHPEAQSSSSTNTTAATGGGTSSGDAKRESSESTDGAKRRAWASRRAQRAATQGGGLVHLHDLERVYKETANANKDMHDIVALFDRVESKSPAEKACAMVLKEIYTTEQVYVGDLRALVGEYIIPLRRAVRRGKKCKEIENGSTICEHNFIRSTCNKVSAEAHPILDASAMKGIFCNTETIMTINGELYGMLTRGLEVVEKKPHPTLSDLAGVFAPAFQKITPFFKMYATYCHNYYTAVDILAHVRSHNQELHEFLTQKEDKSEHVTLPSLIIKPVQRICKYPLLFDNLLKELKNVSGGNVSTEHVAELKKTAEGVEKLAESVNRSVGESDSMEHMLQAFEELGGEKGAPGLMAAHRRFVRTDDIGFIDVGDKSGEHARVLYLFNDALVIAKATGGSSNTLTKKVSHKLSRSLTGSRKSLSADAKQAHHGIAKMDKWFDVEQLTVSPLEPSTVGGASARFGIGLKYVSHSTDDSHKRRTLTRKATGSGKIQTTIEKFEIWMSSKDDRDALFTDISKQIEVQESLTDGQRKAEAEIGAPKKQHSWAHKGRQESGGFGSLQDLAHKYGAGAAAGTKR